MTSDEEKVYETDSLNDAIDNLEMLNTFLESPVKWKWAFIAAHQAVYGFCICALSGTAPKLRVCDENSKGVKAMRLWDLGVSIEIIMEAFGESEKTVKEWISNPQLI